MSPTSLECIERVDRWIGEITGKFQTFTSFRGRRAPILGLLLRFTDHCPSFFHHRTLPPCHSVHYAPDDHQWKQAWKMQTSAPCSKPLISLTSPLSNSNPEHYWCLVPAKLENTISRENNIRNPQDVVVSSRKFSFIYKMNSKTLRICKISGGNSKKTIFALPQFPVASSVKQKYNMKIIANKINNKNE